MWRSKWLDKTTKYFLSANADEDLAASLIIIVALGTMGYFQMIERLNIADTRIQIMEKDLEENTEFRIKWPRGQLGSLPADSGTIYDDRRSL